MARDKQFDWRAAGFDISPELIEMTRQIPVTVLEYSRTLWTLQFDTAESMISEMTRQLKYWLNSAADKGDTLSQWPGLYQPGKLGIGEIARGWLDLAGQASAGMNQLLGQALATSRALAGEKVAIYPGPERRKLAQVIPFADRRRSVGQSGMPAGTSEIHGMRDDAKTRRSSRRRGGSG